MSSVFLTSPQLMYTTINCQVRGTGFLFAQLLYNPIRRCVLTAQFVMCCYRALIMRLLSFHDTAFPNSKSTSLEFYQVLILLLDPICFVQKSCFDNEEDKTTLTTPYLHNTFVAKNKPHASIIVPAEMEQIEGICNINTHSY